MGIYDQFVADKSKGSSSAPPKNNAQKTGSVYDTFKSSSGGGSSIYDQFQKDKQQQNNPAPEQPHEDGFFTKALKGIAKIALPKSLEYKTGLTPRPEATSALNSAPAMEFGIGEGMTPDETKKANDTIKVNLQRAQEERNFAEQNNPDLKIRRKVGEAIGETPLFGIKAAYAPSSEEDLKNLENDYNNSLLGKYTHKENIFKGSFTSGLTGGIIKPETELPKDLSDKVVGALGAVAGTVAGIEFIGSKLNSVAEGSVTIASLFEKYPMLMKYAFPLAKNIAAFDIYGQLDPDVENRLKQLAKDTVTAVPFALLGFIPKARYGIPAAFGLGFGLSKMDGGSNEDAIINGAILGVLDAYGRSGNKGESFVTGRTTDRILKVEAINTINKYATDPITTESSFADIKKSYYQAAHATHPDRNPEMGDANFKAVASAYDFLVGKRSAYTPPAETEAKPGEPVVKEPKQITAPAEDVPAPEKSAIEIQREFQQRRSQPAPEPAPERKPAVQEAAPTQTIQMDLNKLPAPEILSAQFAEDDYTALEKVLKTQENAALFEKTLVNTIQESNDTSLIKQADLLLKGVRAVAPTLPTNDELAVQKKLQKQAAAPKPAAEQPAKSFFRGGGEGSVPEGKTAKDIIDYERTELGNKDIKVEKGIDLAEIPSKNLVWVTETKEAAKHYGKVTTVTPDNYRVIARDSEGGVLIEKLPKVSSKPTADKGDKIKSTPKVETKQVVKQKQKPEADSGDKGNNIKPQKGKPVKSTQGTDKSVQTEEKPQAGGKNEATAPIKRKPKGGNIAEYQSFGKVLNETDRQVTTKVLKRLEQRTKAPVVKKQFIEDLLKQQDVKKVEAEVIRSALENFGDDVNVEQFVNNVKLSLLPLSLIRSDSYANYGHDRLTGRPDGWQDIDNFETFIFDTPFEHGKTGHFSGDLGQGKKSFSLRPLGDTGKWAIVQKGELTEANVSEMVAAVVNTKDEGYAWLAKHREQEGAKASGLFGHIRVWDEASEEGRKRQVEKEITNAEREVETSKRYLEEAKSDLGLIKDPEIQAALQKEIDQLFEVYGTESKSGDLSDFPISTEKIEGKNGILDLHYNQKSKIVLDNGKVDWKQTIKKFQNNVTRNQKTLESNDNTLNFARGNGADILAAPINEDSLIRYIVEVQSDTFQHDLFTETDNAKAEVARHEEAKITYDQSKELLEQVKANTDYEERYSLATRLYVLIDNNYANFGGDTAVRADNIRDSILTRDKEPQVQKAIQNFEEKLNEKIEQNTEILQVKQDRLKELQQNQPPIEKRFLDYKNIWHERMIREGIKQAAIDGMKIVRFPMPHTIASIEGFVSEDDAMPYDVISADSEQLAPGDEIDYGGDRYTVVESTSSDFMAAPSDKVHYINIDDYISESIDNRMSDLEYDIREVQKDFGVTVETPEEAQTLVDRIAEYNNYIEHKTAVKDLEQAKRLRTEKVSDFGKSRIKQLEKLVKEGELPKPDWLTEKLANRDYTYSFDSYKAEDVLQEAADSADETVDLEAIVEAQRDSIAESESENFSAEDLGYDEAYTDDEGRNAYGVEDHAESFSQPDYYKDNVTKENFDINNLGSSQATVVKFYDKQVLPYVRKIRKDAKVITDDYGLDWLETKLTAADQEGIEAFHTEGGKGIFRDKIDPADIVNSNVLAYKERFMDSFSWRPHLFDFTAEEPTKEAYNRIIGKIKNELSDLPEEVITPKQLAYIEDFVNNVPADTLKNLEIQITIGNDLKQNLTDPNVEVQLAGRYTNKRQGGVIEIFVKPGQKWDTSTFHHEYAHHYFEKYLTDDERQLVSQTWDKMKGNNKFLVELFGEGNKYVAQGNLEFYGKSGEIMYQSEMFSRLFERYINNEITAKLEEEFNKDKESRKFWEALKALFEKIKAWLVRQYAAFKKNQVATNPSLDPIFRKIYRADFKVEGGLVKAKPVVTLRRLPEYEKNVIQLPPSEKRVKKDKSEPIPVEVKSPILWGDVPVNLPHVGEGTNIEIPEMVQIVRDLTGEAPSVEKHLPGEKGGGKVLGRFYPTGKGRIKLLASLFKDTQEAARTFAHEIGHLIDYLPDGNIKRGNIIGSLFSLEKHLKATYGNLDVKDPEVRAELKAVGQYWKPFDKNANQAFTKYRNSARELYADAISVLFNDPAALERLAPKFYNSFFTGLDKKPEVREDYFKALALLSGDRSVLVAERRAGVQQMFKDGDYKALELQRKKLDEIQARNSKLWFRLKFDFIDRNYPLIDRVNELKKKGVLINPDDNPVYALEESNYLGGKIKAIFERDFQPAYAILKKDNVDWGVFGEALFYDRIISGDRSEQANPRGITPEAAKELQQDLFTKLGDKAPILKDQMDKFRNGLKKIAEEAHAEGLYSDELYEQMQKNPAYVTYQVIEHLEAGVSSKVYKSIGTLKDITNPADASLLKAIATVRAIERNKVSRKIVEFLQTNLPEEISEAETIFTGKGLRAVEPKDASLGLITYYDKGKSKGFYVDEYITKSVDRDTVGSNNMIVSTLRFMNSGLFRPLFITFNLGFQSFNFLRDFQRYWKNVPGSTILSAIRNYAKAIRPSKIRAFGLSENPTPKDIEANNLIQSLEYSQILSTTFNDLSKGEEVLDTQIEHILQQSGVEGFEMKPGNKLFKPFKAVLDFIEHLGNFIESLPKVAGVYELQGKMPAKEMASFVRRNVGSPDFLAGGYMKPITNEMFLFSNAITQGIRSDLGIATDPKTRSGFWWKTAKKTFLPKILMLAGLLGLFGLKVKQMLEGVSEYDKTNYIVIPLGIDENGKTEYFRFPDDETGRLLGGVLWKAMSSAYNKQPFYTDIADVVSYTGGNLPSLAPSVSSLSAAAQFLAGQNPYDAFRGRNVLTDDQFKAGGMQALKPFLAWEFQQLGGGIFMKYSVGERPVANKTGLQKVLELPILSNVIGRFIRVSDYGKTEGYKEETSAIQGDKAAQRLKQQDIINKLLPEAFKLKGNTYELGLLEKKLVEQGIGEIKTKEDLTASRNLVKKFRVAQIRGQDDPQINALIDASSNDEKIALIKRFKQDLSPEDFQTLQNVAVTQGIASGIIFEKAKQ